MSVSPEKGVNSNRAEGGHERVVSPIFGDGGGDKVSKEAVSLLGNKPAVAAAREASAPLPTGGDLPGMGADRFSKLLAQAGPTDKNANLSAIINKDTNGAGAAAADKNVLQPMMEGKTITRTAAAQPQHADATPDAPKKRAS